MYNKFPLWILTACVFVTSCYHVSANSWDSGGATNLWSDALNWDTNTVPTSTDAAWLNTLGASGLIDGTVSANVNSVLIARSSGATGVTLTVSGGSLTSSGVIFVGQYEGAEGSFSISGGTVDTNSELAIAVSGLGTMTMTGGSVDVATNFKIGRYEQSSAIGHVDLHGGTIECLNFQINSYSSMDIANGGTLIIDGDESSKVTTYIASGQLTANGGANIVNVDYDVTNVGKTTVTASTATTGGGATAPSPADDSVGVSVDTGLSWTSAQGISFDVYIGTSSVDVATAGISDPEYLGTATGTPIDPGTLGNEVTYYWRVDELDASSQLLSVGEVWSFTTVSSSSNGSGGAGGSSGSTIDSTAADGTYLEDLNPMVYLVLDQTPANSATLSNGLVLDKSSSFADDFPTQVTGPNAWVGGAWDFSACDGAYELAVDQVMSDMGDVELKAGITISFWAKGTTDSNVKPRIMAGYPFDIIGKRNSVYGGTVDYKGVDSSGVDPWDGSWHLITTVIDYQAYEDNLRMYVDGDLVGVNSALYLSNLKAGVGSKWYFGGRNAFDAGFDFGALTGIAVYDRPLSEYDIKYSAEGPVFAGLDEAVVLPGTVHLSGRKPESQSASWALTSGPSSAVILTPLSPDTEVQFSEAGEYVFTLSSGGESSSVTITVEEDRAPVVFAGAGVELDSSNMNIILNGSVTDTPGSVLTSAWTVVKQPSGATVSFADASTPTSSVSFSQTGLYQLRLTGSDGVSTVTSDLSVLVTDAADASYLTLLDPIAVFDFDRPASHLGVQLDATGSSAYEVRRQRELPVLVDGARSYTGFAWDFGSTAADLRIVNGAHFKDFHSPEHSGRSLSYWFRVDSDDDVVTYFSTLLGTHRFNQTSLSNTVDKSGAVLGAFNEAYTYGTWNHVVITFSSVNNQYDRRMYLNGSLVDQATDPWPSSWWEWTEETISHPLYIGSRGRTTPGEFFDGEIDDVALFDYILSADQISYIYNGPSAAEATLLSQLDTLSIDAGENVYVELPASYTIALSGSAVSVAGLTPSWRMVEGSGDVVFSNASALSTSATFTPVETDKDGAYSKFVLELALVNSNGRRVIRDRVNVLFYPNRSPDVRSLSATPLEGAHPRVLFAEEDLPELRSKAINVPAAARALAAMSDRGSSLSNELTTYGFFYKSLRDGDPVSVESIYGESEGGFFLTIMEAAYVAWIGTNGQADTAKLTELAQVFTAASREVAEWYEPVYTNALVHDVNWALGLSYDLLYEYMDVAGRNDVRALLSRMTSHRHSRGTVEKAQENSTNWRGYHDHLLVAAAAIEGEDGYDVSIMDDMEAANSVFLTQYGVFESGFPHEGYAYFTFGMTWHTVADYIVMRRGERENLAETTRFYKSIEAGFRLIDPDGSGLRPHHDVVEDNTGAGFMGLPPRHVMLAKYLWPNDRMVDYLYQALLNNLMADEDRRFDLFHAIWGENVTYPTQTLAEAAGERSPNVFCPDRGLVAIRNEWENDGFHFQFRCRMDKYYLGHGHSDVNSFELSSHGRQWIVDRGKFASTSSDLHSTILVDGLGACSSDRFSWPAYPGQFVEYRDESDASISVGDAYYFYKYSRLKPLAAPQVAVADPQLMWSDFYFPREGETTPEWMLTSPVGLNGYNNVDPAYEMFPVERAFRTTVVTKGANPVTLIVDDFQKDTAAHDYTWLANMPINDQIEIESIDQTNLEMVLRYKADAVSGPRLLVKVIDANGANVTLGLNETAIQTNDGLIESTRIELVSHDVVAPDFKVLLYPHTSGDVLPTVQWLANELSIATPTHEHGFEFSVDASGRSIVAYVPPIEAPTGGSSNSGDAVVDLDWADLSEAASYSVYRSTVSGSGYDLLASNLSESAYQDTTVVNGTTYYYVIVGVHANGYESGYSIELVGTPDEPGLPATTLQWDNGASDSLWTSVDNWNQSFTPRDIDGAWINTVGDYVRIETGMTLELKELLLARHDGRNGIVMDMAGGSLTLSSVFFVGQYGTAHGTLNMSGGSMTADSEMAVAVAGAGTLNMTGGSLTTNGNFKIGRYEVSTAMGQVHLDGGVITCGNFAINTVSQMDIEAGTLIINGNRVSTINTYVSSGQLTAYSGGGSIVVDYDTTNPGKTTVTAQPSASIAVVGLAATAGDSVVTLDWDDASSAVSYTVYRSTVSGSGYSLLGTASSSDYSDSTAVNDTTYYYVVTLTDANSIESSYSIEVSGTPVAPALPATTLSWVGAASDNLWTSAANWNQGFVPRAVDGSWITAANASVILDSSMTLTAKEMIIARVDGVQGINVSMTSGALNLTGLLFVGQYGAANGTLSMSGGSITANSEIAIAVAGSAQLEMTGGTLTTPGNFKVGRYDVTTAIGQVDLHGGTIHCNYFAINSYSSMDIESGTLVINGNRVSTINAYVASGALTAYAGSGTIVVDYDVTAPGQTTVTALPAP